LSEAEETLSRLGVRNPAETMAEIAAEAADRGHTDAAKLSWRLHRKPIVLAIAVAMFNQLSGINAILYYLGDIFAAAGFNTVSANAQSIAIGVTNLAAIAARSVAIPFAFFSVMMVLQFVFVLRYLPETRGISLERMQRALERSA
jgi:hypothetical protein